MADLLARGSAAGRRTLAAVTLGSGVALLDGTVVNIAVKQLGEDLDASLPELQWVINGYMLALASLILVGGALGDRWGRRRTYLYGVAGFGVASLLCALAQTPEHLIGLRVLQGVAAAALTPGSLAILQSSFRPQDRSSAIGLWAGVSGLAAALGPLVGGFLLDHANWRWIFLINVPLCLVVLWLGRGIPETRDDEPRPFDVWSALSAVAMLAALTQVLTTWRGMAAWQLVLLAAVIVTGLAGLLLRGRRPGAMVPIHLFGNRIFSAANLMTFLVYGALGAVMFLVVLQLQVTSGYGPIAAGLAAVPITVALLLLSPWFARLADRTGPRLPMTVGPIVCAGGVVLLSGVDDSGSYVVSVLPGMVLFALGLATLVAPLTAAVLAAAPDRFAGVASGINNAVARCGSLLAVAALPAIVGLGPREYDDPAALTAGYHNALLISAALLAVGGAVSWFGLAKARTE